MNVCVCKFTAAVLLLGIVKELLKRASFLSVLTKDLRKLLLCNCNKIFNMRHKAVKKAIKANRAN